jgi:acetolactate decarboxylase
MIDERLIGALHLTSGGLDDDIEPERAHAIFQTSTVAALLDGAYEGDVTFAELAAHGDFGLGTTNGCDGELIGLDGRFYRADVQGDIVEVGPEDRTPFAVLTRFSPRHRLELGSGGDRLDFDDLCERIDVAIGHPEIVHAIRIDGTFERVHCRSVPKQEPPYRPLAEVLAEQSVFDFMQISGTLLGFRFPDFGMGVEIAGYHLHFISEDRRRGGHVLDCLLGPDPVSVAVDDLSDLYVETPPGIAVGGMVDQTSVRRLER